jgi:hypothetical protein
LKKRPIFSSKGIRGTVLAVSIRGSDESLIVGSPDWAISLYKAFAKTHYRVDSPGAILP